MFSCFTKAKIRGVLEDLVYEEERLLLAQQHQTEELECAAKVARIKAETIASRLARLRAQLEEARSKDKPMSGMDPLHPHNIL